MEYKENGNVVATKGVFYGYASVFNVEDSHHDIILNGAFTNSLKTRCVNSVDLLWQHDSNNKIGKFSILREDPIGLYVEGKITEGNDNIYSYVKSGFVNGLSIGYRVNDFYIDDNGRRIIKSLDLIEISIVNFPANKHSNITHCKSLDDHGNPLDRLGHVLDNTINSLS
ncbi:MAG: HK97 family phage prohead protease [Rickettsiales bacterium]|jgi:HK97 family phage prohead protease|nr:HK97 family phage prohead protease [Rickettsiales bacterium]